MTALDLVPDEEGWIARDSNGLHIQGAWYVFGDDYSLIEGSVMSDGSVCAEGYASLVMDEDYGTYYGVKLAFDLCASGASEDPPEEKYTIGDCPYNGSLDILLKGIRFDIEGIWDTFDNELRITFKEEGREECAYVVATSDGSKIALFEDAEVGYDPSEAGTNASLVQSIHFHIPSNQFEKSNFSFCISNVQAVVD